MPLDPGNLSALGLLVSDQRREHVRTFLAPLANLDLDAIVAALGEQERAGRAEMQASSEEVLEIRFAHALDMRYARQGFELTVDLAGAPSEPDDVRRAFLEAYARQYGHAHASGDIEIVNLRTTVIGVTPKPRVRRLRHGGAAGATFRNGEPVPDKVPVTLRDGDVMRMLTPRLRRRLSAA